MDAQRGEFCGIRRRRPGLEIQRQAKGVGYFLHSRGREGADRRTSLSPKWPTNQVVTSRPRSSQSFQSLPPDLMAEMTNKSSGHFQMKPYEAALYGEYAEMTNKSSGHFQGGRG